MKKGLLAAIMSGVLIIGAATFVPGIAQTTAQTEAQAVTAPINLNTATDEQILSVPGVGERMLREFKEYTIPTNAKLRFTSIPRKAF